MPRPFRKPILSRGPAPLQQGRLGAAADGEVDSAQSLSINSRA
jgi:hypothetical protein